MKFKPIFLYGALFITVIIFLIFVSNQSVTNDVVEKPFSGEGNMPDDSVHSSLRSGEQPGKDNVSDEFKQKVEALKNAIEENPNDTTALKKYADLMTAAHMKEDATKYYNRILQIDPNRTDILFSLSFIYYSRGDLKNAKESTNKILAIEPDNANALYNLGTVYARNGETEKAREIWTKIAGKYPDKDIGIRAKNSIEQL